MSKIFVIVVTYNGKQWYDCCFTSLRESDIPVNLVVVDNASSDDTVSYIQAHYQEVYLIKSGENLGFGQANNKGIRYALDHNADYVFLLNQDAWIEPNTIKELIRIHLKNPEYGVLSPIHLNAQKSSIEKSLLGFLTYHEHINLELISDFYIGLKKEIYDVREVNAAAWLIPRLTLERVGGFDPIFFHYAEDDNYLSRVLYHGLKIGLVPSVTICHDTETTLKKSAKQSSTFDKWLLQRSTDILYPDKHVDEMIWEYAKKTIMKLFTLHQSTMHENFFNALFLLKYRNNILLSRKKNKLQGRTWL